MGAPFYPSCPSAIENMLNLAEVNAESIVYDLGCGDGRIVLAAARNHSVKKAVGVERSEGLYRIALAKIRHLPNASIVKGNYDDVDLSEANVVTIYQSASENARLKRKFLEELATGSKIVSNDFGIPGWRPQQLRTFREGRRGYRILVYVMGANSPC